MVFTAELDHPTLTESDSDQTVKLSIQANKGFSADGVGARILYDTPLVPTSVTSDDIPYAAGDITLGMGSGQDSIAFTYEDSETRTDLKNVAVITYKIPANTPAGEYTVGLKGLEITENYGDIWEPGVDVTAKVVVQKKVVATPLTFADSSDYDIPAGVAGTSYTVTKALEATGGIAPYTFAVDPAVPGLTINRSHQLVYNRPETAQPAATATIKVTDSGNPASSKTIQIAIGAVTKTVKVIFDVQGHGKTPAIQELQVGQLATEPKLSESGWTFEGWYTSLSFSANTKFDFSKPITQSVTLYAKWTANATKQYTLTYQTNGGSGVPATKHNANTDVTLTATSTRTGYTFTGWYSDATLANKITHIKMDNDKTVYAGWKKKTANSSHDCPSKQLKDVDVDQWYHEYVDYVVEKGLMKGVSANLFAPNSPTTRAMIVTILYRLEGSPAVSGTRPFDDVEAGSWYANAVAWAEGNQIVQGYGEGKFGPMGNITREQFATILYRYSKFKGYDVSKMADLSSYEDVSAISDWALTAMKWANAKNLITGRTGTTLVPGGEATRAEAAAILMRYIEQ